MSTPSPSFPAPPDGHSYRDQLMRVFQEHAPDKVYQVDRLLAKYSGREDTLMEAVRKKVGGRVTPPLAATVDVPNTDSGLREDVASFRERLLAVYEAYAPAKKNTVDHLLQKYAGREEDLIAAAVHKYGPEPTLNHPTQTCVYTCSPSPSVDATIATTSMDRDYHAEIVALYTQYAPWKLSTVDAQMQKYKGREAALVDAIRRKYAATAEAISTPCTLSDTCSQHPYRDELIALYQTHAPHNLPKVDYYLSKYHGREEKFLRRLRKKYTQTPSSTLILPLPLGMHDVTLSHGSGTPCVPHQSVTGSSSEGSHEPPRSILFTLNMGRLVATAGGESDATAEAGDDAGPPSEVPGAFLSCGDRAGDSDSHPTYPPPLNAGPTDVSDRPSPDHTVSELRENGIAGREDSPALSVPAEPLGRYHSVKDDLLSATPVGPEDCLVGHQVADAVQLVEPCPFVDAETNTLACGPNASDLLSRSLMAAPRSRLENVTSCLPEATRMLPVDDRKGTVESPCPSQMSSARAEQGDAARLPETQEPDTCAQALRTAECSCRSPVGLGTVTCDPTDSPRGSVHPYRAGTEASALGCASGITQPPIPQKPASTFLRSSIQKPAECLAPITSASRASPFVACRGRSRATTYEREEREKLTYYLFSALGTIQCKGDGGLAIDGEACNFLLGVAEGVAVTEIVPSRSLVSESGFCSHLERLLRRGHEWDRVAERIAVFLAHCDERLDRDKECPHAALHFGFWTYWCLLPALIPRWKRRWAVLHTDNRGLQLFGPGGERVDVELPFSHVARCKLDFWEGSSAPCAKARHGVRLGMDGAPTPLEVCLCVEDVRTAQDIAKCYRRWTAGHRFHSLPQDRSMPHSHGGTVDRDTLERTVGAPTATLSFTPVWYHSVGGETAQRALWAFASGRLAYKFGKTGHTLYTWNLSEMEDAVSTSQRPTTPAPPLAKYGFIVRGRSRSTIFCWTSSHKQRQHILNELKRGKLRHSLLPSSDAVLYKEPSIMPDALLMCEGGAPHVSHALHAHMLDGTVNAWADNITLQSGDGKTPTSPSPRIGSPQTVDFDS